MPGAALPGCGEEPAGVEALPCRSRVGGQFETVGTVKGA
jgi:hypothetical protein